MFFIELTVSFKITSFEMYNDQTNYLLYFLHISFLRKNKTESSGIC